MKVLTQPQIVTQTANGEITINLNITLTLNQDGFSVSADAKPVKKDVDIEIPDSLFAIPEFQSEKPLEGFGIDTTR
jgi:hypothetical protein